MRRTSEQVIAEFHRLYDCLEIIQDCSFNGDGNYWTIGLGSHMVTRSTMLAWVSEKKATPSQILAGTREALNDTSEYLVHMLEDDPQAAMVALSKYQMRTGRDYWQDAGHPKKLVKGILRRGRILNETEYRLITAWVADTANIVLGESDVPLANEMLTSFESSARQEDNP